MATGRHPQAHWTAVRGRSVDAVWMRLCHSGCLCLLHSLGQNKKLMQQVTRIMIRQANFEPTLLRVHFRRRGKDRHLALDAAAMRAPDKRPTTRACDHNLMRFIHVIVMLCARSTLAPLHVTHWRA